MVVCRHDQKRQYVTSAKGSEEASVVANETRSGLRSDIMGTDRV